MPKKTLEVATKNNNDILVQVKANQKQLLANCEDTARFSKPVETYKSELTKSHGRMEQRSVSVFTDLSFIEDSQWKKYVESIILVNRHRESFSTELKQWIPSHEKSYYIFTSVFTAKKVHDMVKDHWLIENSNNHVRDVSFKEDENKTKNAAGILARMRSFSLNILRYNNVKSVKETLYENSLNLDFIMEYNI